MKTVIEMAREAGFMQRLGVIVIPNIQNLERFAELVRADERNTVMNEPLTKAQWQRFEDEIRADEREKYKWDIHSCGPTCKRYACVAMREAVEAENEECAKVCDGWEFVPGGHEFTPQQLTKNLTDTLATQIRARRST